MFYYLDSRPNDSRKKFEEVEKESSKKGILADTTQTKLQKVKRYLSEFWVHF